jgi:hypothetical protein
MCLSRSTPCAAGCCGPKLIVKLPIWCSVLPRLGVAPKRSSWAGTRGAFTKVKGSRETLPSWFPRIPAINGDLVLGALVLGGLRPDPIAFLLSPLAGQLSPEP